MATLKSVYLRLPGDFFDRAFLIILAFGTLIVLIGYPWIASEVPIHFDRNLQPTRFIGKPLGPFFLLALASLMYGLAFPLIGFLASVGLDFLRGVVKTVHLALAVFLAGLNVLLCLNLLPT